MIEVQSQEVSDAMEVQPPVKRTADEIEEARSLVPAAPQIIAPAVTLQQQIDYAQAMAKAVASIPKSFAGNVGDCLALVDIALRANLSPYMVASQCYVEPKSGRLSFMSQLFHALLQSSGLLKGELDVVYEGAGEERVCIVRGALKTDPTKIKEARSKPLKDARPVRNTEGTVKGSPLWDKKPDVQLFYDTSRDWVRMFAPRATLGVYAPEEFDEYGPEFARDVSPSVGERVLNGKRAGREGFKEGHVDGELSQVAPAGGGKIIDHVEKKNAATPKTAKPKVTTKPKPAPATAAKTPQRAAINPPKRSVQEAADLAEKTSKVSAAAKETKAAASAKVDIKKPAPPSNAAEYIVYARAWIDKATDADDIEARYEGEDRMRDDVKLSIKDRNLLRASVEGRVAKLRDGGK